MNKLGYKDLCEYYNVSLEDAIRLGQRRMKHDMPGSITCRPVTGMNIREIWDLYPRNTLQEKMNFYKDVGSFLVFIMFAGKKDFNFSRYFGDKITENSNVLEYGCGIAPITNFYLENDKKYNITNNKFCLVDVEGEPIEFAEWRLKKKNPNANITFHKLSSKYPLPNFTYNFDSCFLLDVFEHLPSPYDVMLNIINHCNKDCWLIFTWIDKSSNTKQGPDLLEAESDRPRTMKLINSEFNLIKNGSVKIYRKR